MRLPRELSATDRSPSAEAIFPKLARYRIWRFDVQIVDTLNRAQPIAPTIILPLSDEINWTVLTPLIQ
jgi:hypothetical protein